jgi:hypothetical protein
MAIDLTNFWDLTSPAPAALSTDLVRQAEAQLGVSLPPELLTLLAQQNGGDTRGFAFLTQQPTSWAKNHVPFDELFGLVLPSDKGPVSMLDTAYLTQEWGLPEKQVLLSGDGHWFITLDYRQGPAPSVAWIDTEVDQDIQLAESFAAFLAGLVDRELLEED